MDGASSGKSGPIGIGSILCDHNGEPVVVFLELIGKRESNETELFSIRKALTMWNSLGLDKLVTESDLTNAIKWVLGVNKLLWKLVTMIREMNALLEG